MALATKCPHCNTIFRVAADQLKLCGGIVRCGSCNKVFDGNAALLAPGSPVTPAAAVADAAPPAVAVVVPMQAGSAAVPALTDFSAIPVPSDGADAVFTLDFDTSFDPFGTIPSRPATLPTPVITASEEEPDNGPGTETGAQTETDAETDADSDVDAGPNTITGQRTSAYTVLDFDLDTDFVIPEESRVQPALEVAPAESAPEPVPEPVHVLEAELEPEAEPEPEPETAPEPAVEPVVTPESEPLPEQQPEPTPEPEQEPEPAAEPEPVPEPPPAPVPVAENALPEPEEHIELTAVPFDDQPDHGSASVASLIKKRAAVEPEPETASEPATTTPARARSAKRRASIAAAKVPTDDVADTTDSDQHPTDTVAKTDPETEAEVEAELPGFVKQARRRERMGRTMRVIMTVGSVLLTGALLLQGMTTYRNQLAAQVPQLKPLLVAACAQLGCNIELPSQIDALSVEQGELQSLSATTFSYATVLRNQSGSAQAWPSIELVLNDGTDRPVLRRILAPADYLPSAPLLASGFAARSEQPVRLHFSLAGVKASGYHIAIFYP